MLPELVTPSESPSAEWATSATICGEIAHSRAHSSLKILAGRDVPADSAPGCQDVMKDLESAGRHKRPPLPTTASVEPAVLFIEQTSQSHISLDGSLPFPGPNMFDLVVIVVVAVLILTHASSRLASASLLQLPALTRDSGSRTSMGHPGAPLVPGMKTVEGHTQNKMLDAK
ncbi:hypothetical protein CTA1_11072 [Colletotrichum tanaceti]|uniref:Uncharacterized protein n=1 Tax=Colletotrichum tanaceti TaxID=1306861 RepID=A0A4U6XLC0_9PEZI|nr:hypothetical protein CTA1_11072 [Colletotrichum tanaceti]